MIAGLPMHILNCYLSCMQTPKHQMTGIPKITVEKDYLAARAAKIARNDLFLENIGKYAPSVYDLLFNEHATCQCD